MKSAAPKFIFALLLAVAYTLGIAVHLRAVSRADLASVSDGAFKKLLGDGRKLFAGQFVEMADVYFHSGVYPSIFDRAQLASAPKAVTSAVSESADHDHDHAGHQHDANGNCVHASPDDHDHEHDHETHGHSHDDDEHVAAMTPAAASNWLEAFIRRFRITEHTHLEDGQEREILPWLKLAIELDPQAVETYTTSSFWLRSKLGNVEQAEKVLREGIRNNPSNPELLFEMGRLLKENRHDVERARNIWRYAMQCWLGQPEAVRAGSGVACSRIATSLAALEREVGNSDAAIKWFEFAKPYSPSADSLQQQIDELRSKSGAPALQQ